MKKIIALMLALALLCSLAACTKRPEESALPTEPDNKIEAPETGSNIETPPAALPEKPEEAPSAEPVDVNDPEPSVSPVESPEPSEAPEEPEETPAPSAEPEKESDPGVNEGKVDTSASVSSTATDLNPVNNAMLSLIPELPFEGWALTSLGENSVMLELSPAPSDCQSKLMEYIQLLKDKDFTVTEYIYGSLYEAVKGDVTVNLMLEGGKLTVTIDKK